MSDGLRSVGSMETAHVRRGLVRPVRLDPTGRAGPTRSQARGSRWRRTSHGFYVPSHVDGDQPEQRILEASVVVPRGSAITGWAALRWLGGRWFTGVGADGARLPVQVLISSQDIRNQEGVVCCGEGCGPEHVMVVDGVRVTDPAWTVAFLMRRSSGVRRAVRAFDMAAYSDLVSEAEVRAVIDQQYAWTGVPQARDAVALVSENSWSPKETDFRITWTVVAGFPTPLANRPVFDVRGRHLATPDLIDDRAGVVGEYDGPDHLDRAVRRSDLARDEILRSHGLEVVRTMAGDSVEDVVRRLRGAYDRASRRTDRRWTIALPPRWRSTHTVDLRRSLTVAERGRLLGYRAA